MKILTLLTLLLSFSVAFAQKIPVSVTYDFPLTRVIDGDTVAFAAPFLPGPLKPELSIRIWGVDTPESTKSMAKCPGEIVRGKAASQFTRDTINAASVRQITIMSWDKYGGRVLGDVILDGKSLRDTLIAKGFAHEYYGGAKHTWCN